MGKEGVKQPKLPCPKCGFLCARVAQAKHLDSYLCKGQQRENEMHAKGLVYVALQHRNLLMGLHIPFEKAARVDRNDSIRPVCIALYVEPCVRELILATTGMVGRERGWRVRVLGTALRDREYRAAFCAAYKLGGSEAVQPFIDAHNAGERMVGCASSWSARGSA